MTGYRSRRAIPDKQESVASATNRLLMLLTGCRDEALAGFTAEHLHRIHRVPLATCSRMLREERDRRDSAMVLF